jgi:pimeloyl-ACP methyl ester carboxylesterase
MMFALGIIACQEDFSFNSEAGYEAVAETYRFPSIDAAARKSTIPLYGFCSLFEKHPRAGLPDPVDSDIPVLAMSGTKDTQTVPDAAKQVVRTLTNGQSVLFPEAGHAVIQFSKCAKDIAESFLEAPTMPVNDACAEWLKLEFYVPPAEQ